MIGGSRAPARVATGTRGRRYLGRYPTKMADGGSVLQADPRTFFLPRGSVPDRYGELLAGAGLPNNPGPSWGPSDVTFPSGWSDEQLAKAEALITSPSIKNQDLLRFVDQQGGGPLGLPGGGDSGPTAPNSATPSEGASFDMPSFNTDFTISPETGGRIGGVVGGVGGALLGALTGPAAVGVSPVLGALGAYAGKETLGPRITSTINSLFGGGRTGPGTLNTSENQIEVPDIEAAPAAPPQFTPGQLSAAGSLGISNPSAQGFAFSGSPTGFVDIAGNPLGQAPTGREDIGPPAPPSPPTEPDAPTGPPAGVGPDNPDGPSGSGPSGGGSGAGGGSAGGASGDASDAEARGGVVTRRPRNPVMVRGGWQGAKRFATGGGVPMYYQRGGPAAPMSEREARARRVRAFELAHGTTRV